MEEKRDTLGLLDLMIRPGFCVKENKIIKVNQAAQGYFLTTGMEMESLLLTGKEEYRDFTGGCLYLTLSLSGKSVGASVTRMEDVDVFMIEQEADVQELHSMALAARQFRDPLANVMATAERLFPLASNQEDTQTKEQIARPNQGAGFVLRLSERLLLTEGIPRCLPPFLCTRIEP